MSQDGRRRLESVLWRGAISAFRTYSQGDPAVCLTETSDAGINFLIRDRGYEPWALMFDRQKVYDAGGGPVWYARPEEYAALSQHPRLRSWTVRLDPGSDWLEEREWRIPRPMPFFELHQPDIALPELGLAGVIVGDPSWKAAKYLEKGPGDGRAPDWYYPGALQGISRFYWDTIAKNLVPISPIG